MAHDPSCMYITARHMQGAERHIYKLFPKSNPKINLYTNVKQILKIYANIKH